MSKVVLISGCSSGIRRDLARRLSEMEGAIAATARNLDPVTQMDAPLKLALDVAEPESVCNAVEALMQAQGSGRILNISSINQDSPYHTLYQKYQQVLATPRPKARYLAGVDLPTALVLHLRDIVWGTAGRQMFRA